MQTPFLRAVLAVVSKDFQVELRSKELLSTMGMFALLSILIFSFALELDRQARQEVISGVLWVTVVFASILGLNRSLAAERDQGNMDALLLAPVGRGAVFCGKLAGNFAFTLVIALVMLPVMTILYNRSLLTPLLLATLLLGTFGFTTMGTLLATMTVQTRAREALLPIVLLPAALPVLIASVAATTGLLDDAPAEQWLSWLQILLVVDLIYIVLSVLLFRYVIED